MKSLSIPLIPETDNLPLKRAMNILEEQGAKISVESVNWPQQFGYKPLTSVWIAHSKEAIYILFQVHENCLRACQTKDNQPVNEDSCVEFFVKRTDSDYYYNFEFNCIGVCKAAKHFKDRVHSKEFSSEQLHKIGRWPSLGNRAFKEMGGMFTWELCVNIPFSLIDVETSYLPEKLLGNFYKCADATEQPHYISWNPVLTERPDFHRPEFFGELLLSPD